MLNLILIKKNINYKKVAIIGATVVWTALLAYGGYKIYQNGGFDKFVANGKEIVDSNIKDFENNLGSKNLDFIRNSGVFESQFPKDNMSDLCTNFINNFTEEQNKIFSSDQLRSCTDDELRALQIYTTSWYHDINKFLRKGKDDLIRDPKIIESIAGNLKEAFKKIELSSDVKVSRGVDSDVVKNHIFGEELYNKIMGFKNNTSSGFIEDIKGMVNLDPGVMSTSANVNGKVIESFSGKNGIIIDISAKKGQNGIFLEALSEAPYEREIAFAPDSALKFTGEYKIINGIVHLMADLLQD